MILLLSTHMVPGSQPYNIREAKTNFIIKSLPYSLLILNACFKY